MKVILAFDSFKGSLTADQAVHTAAIGVSDASAVAEIVCLQWLMEVKVRLKFLHVTQMRRGLYVKFTIR